jgi:hypothetical protein
VGSADAIANANFSRPIHLSKSQRFTQIYKVHQTLQNTQVRSLYSISQSSVLLLLRLVVLEHCLRLRA